MLEFTVEQKNGYAVISFEIPGGVLEPDQLREIKAPKVELNQGIVLSGRGPIWLYNYLAHEYHTAQWVATFDPRFKGAIVTQSHIKGVEVGQRIDDSYKPPSKSKKEVEVGD